MKGGQSMDFYQIEEKSIKGALEIYPDFKVCRSTDLMIRGKSFYAIWDADKQMWSTDEYDVQRLVDEELAAYKKRRSKTTDANLEVKWLSNFSSKIWTNFKNYISQMADNSHQLDENLTFSNMEVKKTDYVSRKLPYPLEKGNITAYDELMSTLYDPEEREKLEWAIGAIISGDAKYIQKFVVLYGEAGSGKSTFLNILQKLFVGYYTSFDAKALTSTSNAFSTEVFRSNPLVAIQHDGDLSRIEDNTKINSIVSHEEMTMNEKYKASYTSRTNCFLFMGTNKPVRITDAKSGIIRRLIDVIPSGRTVPPSRYHTLLTQIDFELGGIAWHCLEVYRSTGKNYYSSYRPMNMILQTDVFFNYVEANYHVFKEQNGITLSQAYEIYKVYCDESLVEFKLPRHKFREELKSYFGRFDDVTRIEGKQVRSYYSGFLSDKFSAFEKQQEMKPHSLVLDETVSLLDELLADCYAQYASPSDKPETKWAEVKTRLCDIDTSRVHYLRPPENHIVIDFDIKDNAGNKSLDRNIEEASKWPPTYAEISKSGSGIHLHYIYEGDVDRLSRLYSEGIEVKVFVGNSSLRRRVSKCNNLSVATINSGLPLKGEKKMINFETTTNEKAIRTLIAKNLAKEYHAGTKPSVDFIYKILDDAYNSGVAYDVTDLRPKILAFANNSTNNSVYCIKLVNKMKFASEEISENINGSYQDDSLVFFDVEVFPNLFIVVWKPEGKEAVKMINPTSQEIEEVMRFKLVGFNCRRYDNHIIYARYIGYDNAQLYNLSQKIIGESRNCLFGEAYNISYADVYDFSSQKQSLKLFEIELGLHHQELGLRWDEEVPIELWEKVADYCANDVIATEAVFLARKQDFIARQILADLSGLTVNDTTQRHTAKIIFGDDKRPQDKFIYTDLRETFPGYVYENGNSTYRGEDPSEGGYVYAEPGMYTNVAVLDVASMHPTSLVRMNMFGPYTKNFDDLLNARIEIKHKNYDAAKQMLGGILSKYLTSEDDSVKLSYALKIVINMVYGLTSAKFENKFKDPRNKDNIVAKRGALFMIDLKHAVQERGFVVAHIKTDSIKIPEATQEIIDFVIDFGKTYGYTFEHESTYRKMCLVNDAVYIAHEDYDEPKIKNGEYKGPWTATGAQFAQPYVFKTLFSHEDIVFEDLCETKTVTSALYLDMNESLPEDEHDYHFVGKAGSFCPIKSGCGGGVLLRENANLEARNGRFSAVTGTKGYRWLEAELVKTLGKEGDIDRSYYSELVDAAIDNIAKYGDVEWFISEYISNPIGFDDIPPMIKDKHTCSECSYFYRPNQYSETIEGYRCPHAENEDSDICDHFHDLPF